MKQTIILLLAVITSGVFIAFLLYGLKGETSYGQRRLESWIPEKQVEKKEENKSDENSETKIRVLIKTNDFQSIYHEKVEVSSAAELEMETAANIKHIGKNKKVKIKKHAVIRSQNQEEKITIHSIERGYGIPAYRGTLEVFQTDQGYVIINELTVEEYLCSVVPSEMPASYETEALKAQAVCARSYAYNQMQKMAYPEYNGHVDDSVSYQVYNNWEENEKTNQAVEDTKGELLWYGEEVAKTYFYSTSSGYSTSVEAWGTNLAENNEYLSGVVIADEEGTSYEENQDWYRWSAVIDKQTMKAIIEKNGEQELGELKSIKVTKRGAGNVALQLVITGSAGTITVENENAIRKMLGGDGYQITKQDGTKIKSMQLLPSAFITIEENDGSFIINGGGYGHGIGMSQSGANEMAKKGGDYKEILAFFYPGTVLKKE